MLWLPLGKAIGLPDHVEERLQSVEIDFFAEFPGLFGVALQDVYLVTRNIEAAAHSLDFGLLTLK